MMFLDCPAYLDEEGALRCGLPAEVKHRFTMRSSGGPLEAAMIRCPSGHWFNGPIEFLAPEKGRSTIRAIPKLPSSARRDTLKRTHDGHDGRGGFVIQESTGQRSRKFAARTAPPPTTWGGPPPCGSPS